MTLTDDNFATIVKAVEIGRGLYDNLTKYIRFQMGVLSGMILAFLGAAIFNVAAGVLFVPLQTLWLNFTTQVFQAIGLGYGKFADDLMARQPRNANEAILDRLRLVWIAIAGLEMAVGTVGIAWYADDHHGAAVARTMALTTFSIANLLFSFTALDERRTIFSMDTFADRKLLVFSGMSVAAIVLGTELDVQPLPADDRPDALPVGCVPARAVQRGSAVGGVEVVPAQTHTRGARTGLGSGRRAACALVASALPPPRDPADDQREREDAERDPPPVGSGALRRLIGVRRSRPGRSRRPRADARSLGRRRHGRGRYGHRLGGSGHGHRRGGHRLGRSRHCHRRGGYRHSRRRRGRHRDRG